MKKNTIHTALLVLLVSVSKKAGCLAAVKKIVAETIL